MMGNISKYIIKGEREKKILRCQILWTLNTHFPGFFLDVMGIY